MEVSLGAAPSWSLYKGMALPPGGWDHASQWAFDPSSGSFTPKT